LARFHIQTFGCKVNQCDSQLIRETLTSWELREGEAQDADLIVINTCTVTGTADAKFRKALRRARRENPRAAIVVTGCFAARRDSSRDGDCGADLLFGMRDMRPLAEFLLQRGFLHSATAQPVRRQSYFAEHTRAFLKIQDGCDCFCSYCIVPLVRPYLWSEEPDTVINAINELAAKGYKEVVLTGIHLGFYRRDSGQNGLAFLLRRIADECGIARVRLSSIEINEVSDEIISILTSSEKFCDHLHLPLQSGDDTVLAAMSRRYSSESFVHRVEDIREHIPDIGISTDVMVGFPGETDEQCERTMQVVEKVGFVKTHVFRFSPRAGTSAAAMEPVSSRLVTMRARRMIEVADIAARGFRERFLGKSLHVLPETCDEDGASCIGLSSNYIRVKVQDVSTPVLNTIIPVTLVSVGTEGGAATGKLETAKRGGLSYG
jgi:threonylcarbamoyladenosine tRNA methylthiotransferase MtaB